MRSSVDDAQWTTWRLLLLLVYLPTCCLASTVAQWTEFFNTDSPKDGLDEESYSNIQMLTGLVCHTGKPTQVECRVVGDDELFHHKTEYRSNYLSVPCNLTGLLCDDYLQREGVQCYDYEIRFLCTVDEPAVPQFLTNGGSLGLGVGLSILIPLLCAVVLQCKKSRAERRRQVAATASRDPVQTTPPQPAAGNLDLPPAYETLFPSLPSDSAPSAVPAHHTTVDIEASNSDPSPTTRPSPGAWRPPANAGPLLGTSSSVDNQSTPGLFTITLPMGNAASDSQNEGTGNGVSSGLMNSHPGVLCPRRFPGMHLALHELWGPVMGDDVTPPPSYADALKMINMIFEDKASS